MGSGRIDAVTRCALVVAACWRWVAFRPVRPELVMTLPRCAADVLTDHVRLEIVRVIHTPEATHIRYRVRH